VRHVVFWQIVGRGRSPRPVRRNASKPKLFRRLPATVIPNGALRAVYKRAFLALTERGKGWVEKRGASGPGRDSQTGHTPRHVWEVWVCEETNSSA
jgi:hypothetical protein